MKTTTTGVSKCAELFRLATGNYLFRCCLCTAEFASTGAIVEHVDAHMATMTDATMQTTIASTASSTSATAATTTINGVADIITSSTNNSNNSSIHHNEETSLLLADDQTTTSSSLSMSSCSTQRLVLLQKRPVDAVLEENDVLQLGVKRQLCGDESVCLVFQSFSSEKKTNLIMSTMFFFSLM